MEIIQKTKIIILLKFFFLFSYSCRGLTILCPLVFNTYYLHF